MYSIKPGRGPSLGGVVGGVVGVIFGIGWTVMAFVATGTSSSNIPQDFPGEGPSPNAVLSVAHIIFPLAGIAFILAGIFSVIYNLYNATAPNRMSLVDITTDQSEPDPLEALVQKDHPNAPIFPVSTESAISDDKIDKSDIVQQRVAEIEALRSRGTINDAEFNTQRNRILNSI